MPRRRRVQLHCGLQTRLFPIKRLGWIFRGLSLQVSESRCAKGAALNRML